MTTTATDIVGQGTLDTTAGTLRTGAGTEKHIFSFRNKGGASRTLTIYLNGNTDAKEQFSIAMAADDTVVYRCGLGNGDTVQAKSSDDNTSIHWTDIMDNLT